METTDIKGYKRICPYCGTSIISMYEKQLDFNFNVHMTTCKDNPKKIMVEDNSINQEKQNEN